MRYFPTLSLPPYAYVPGRLPHPTKDPEGHSYRAGGNVIQLGANPGDQPWYNDPRWLWGADLFNHRFYWEAHECWEELWKEQPVGTPERSLLQAAILAAASLLQRELGRERISEKSWCRAQVLLQHAPPDLEQGWSQEDFWTAGPSWEAPPVIIVSAL